MSPRDCSSTSARADTIRLLTADRNKKVALPQLLTSDEAAAFLRTSRKAIYALVERGQLPGVIRVGRRVLFLADELVDWLDQKRTPSLEE